MTKQKKIMLRVRRSFMKNFKCKEIQVHQKVKIPLNYYSITVKGFYNEAVYITIRIK